MIEGSYLIVDSHHLCYRAWYSTPGLKNGEVPTGIAFGFLRDVVKCIDLFEPTVCVFAFDYGGPGLRHEIDAGYKASRLTGGLSDEEKKIFIAQVKTLFKEILPELGFKNLFRVKGFEGDDIVAKVAEGISESSHAVIISGDEDLWQCLRSNVDWYSPAGKPMTAERFHADWGLPPVRWAEVKALAGCSTDDVTGIHGVGPATAAKWLKGELKSSSKKYQAIAADAGIIDRNLPLVKLPFEGTPDFDIVPDEYDETKRRQVYSNLGFRDRRPAQSGFNL